MESAHWHNKVYASSSIDCWSSDFCEGCDQRRTPWSEATNDIYQWRGDTCIGRCKGWPENWKTRIPQSNFRRSGDIHQRYDIFCMIIAFLAHFGFSSDYHCVLGGKMMLHGRIYITDRYIMFYSKIFGRQKKVMVPFSQVNSIVQPTGQMFRSIVVEAGSFSTLDPSLPSSSWFIHPFFFTGTKSYTFHSFWEPEKSFYYVMDAYEKFKATNERTPIKDRPVEIEDGKKRLLPDVELMKSLLDIFMVLQLKLMNPKWPSYVRRTVWCWKSCIRKCVWSKKLRYQSIYMISLLRLWMMELLIAIEGTL